MVGSGLGVDNRWNCLPKTASRRLRPFRYLRIPPQDRERVHLVRERVKCGKPSCHCARGLRHGPYTFFRYQYWDIAAGRDRYARECVPRTELPRVRRWIRRARAETALGWRSEEHTSELQSLAYLVCRLLLEKKKNNIYIDLP